MSYVLQVATEKSDKTKNVAGHNQGRTHGRRGIRK